MTASDPGGGIDAWIRAGYDAHQRGDLAAAAAGYSAVLAADGGHKDALYLLGVVRMAEAEFAQAAGLFERAVNADPGVAAFQAGRAEALLRLGRGAEAVEGFRAALRLEPESAEARDGLVAALQSLGRYEEAHGQMRRWLQGRLRARAPDPRTAATLIPGTTLVCADCAYQDLAADAIVRTLAHCRFERVLFFTDVPIVVPGAQTVPIPAIASLQDYSRFMIKGLHRYVETDFALVIQYDGYVLDGSRWSPEFQGYDYVGAPWPGAEGLAVGNGGFSLRSRKLLRALQDPDLEPGTPEDAAICRSHRPLLEQRHGLRFAPPEVAARFSFEALPPAAPTFGFHGVSHLYRMFDMSDAERAAYRPAPMKLYEK